VSTLYFEANQGDGFREPGFSKERRLEPQITIGLLTGQDGFPLMVSAFEGNKAETKTMLPVSGGTAEGLPRKGISCHALKNAVCSRRELAKAAGAQ
jgi:transposase